ncbi:Dehydrogenase [Mycena venus]|uniref:Dehydrogenase n=1 Tax=Mycena venus TaxID=2733690 RepID=A0A8H6XGY8_9AGAR|nr:Dehydrogenase [Mycena venus]
MAAWAAARRTCARWRKNTPTRADETRAKCPEAEAILIGDLSSLDETKALAAEANNLGPYEAVLHNAGLYTGMERVPGKSGLPSLFTVNTLAPYMLTCLMNKPKRLLFSAFESTNVKYQSAKYPSVSVGFRLA